MKIVRTSLRILGRVLLGVLVCIICYALAIWLLPLIPVNNDFQEAPNGTMIYIRSNGVHTDVVLPLRSAAKDWSAELPFANTASGDSNATHVAFGWGDKGFYLETKEWADLKASTAFNAAFGLSGSAMHVTHCDEPVEGEMCLAVRVSDAMLQCLTTHVESGFAKGTDGKPVWIAHRYYESNDAFYEGTGSYGLFFTCNTWTNSVLKDCGLPAALWAAFDGGILRQYDEKNQRANAPEREL